VNICQICIYKFIPFLFLVLNILLLGESGTGIGLIAQFIHKNSKRAGSPFIPINCAALPESLLEAELFGFEKGAFTGAGAKGKIGLFELAQNETILLDEILPDVVEGGERKNSSLSSLNESRAPGLEEQLRLFERSIIEHAMRRCKTTRELLSI